ncbi:MAG TPA: helix-turn-helix transcriptional regulator [Candidatus Limnocylindrales bacterium]|nr:helix-turn-helix transcriptional regulator [Candidatus Limnocylindrales bacterium]
MRLEERTRDGSGKRAADPTHGPTHTREGDTGRHEPVDLSFAIWLSRQLRRQRLTQRELARRSGLAHSTISRILLGQREPSWATLQRLALVIGYPPPNVLLGRFGVRVRADADEMAAGDR